MSLKVTQFHLFHTLGCHLCDDAEELIALLNEHMIDGHEFVYEKVDIADDDDLIERYGVRIPVLRSIKTEAELGWPFDVEALALFYQDELQAGEGEPQ